jgi:small subunit ribosomal protein S17
MAEETDNTENETPETPETPEAEAPEASEAEAPAEEAPVEEAPAEEAPAAEAGPAGPAGEPKLPARERVRANRAARARGRASRTPEERHAERVAERERKARARRARRPKERERAKAFRAAHPVPELPAPEHGPGRPKVRQGIVVSDKADKTITVRIDDARRHRMYKKIIRTSTTLHAHDERNEANEGDTVTIIESRPLSRTKRWRLVDVLERAK